VAQPRNLVRQARPYLRPILARLHGITSVIGNPDLRARRTQFREQPRVCIDAGKPWVNRDRFQLGSPRELGTWRKAGRQRSVEADTLDRLISAASKDHHPVGSPQTTTIHYRDTGSSGIEYEVRVTARWLGTNTGKEVVAHWLTHLERIREWTRHQVPRLSADETVRLQGLLARGR
jgi:hypothetical protein